MLKKTCLTESRFILKNELLTSVKHSTWILLHSKGKRNLLVCTSSLLIDYQTISSDLLLRQTQFDDIPSTKFIMPVTQIQSFVSVAIPTHVPLSLKIL